MSAEYTFPSHFPHDCPPNPQEELPGIYYRVVPSETLSNRENFQSHFELNLRPDLEDSEPCSRRAVSMFGSYASAVNLSKQYPNKGKFIASLNLNGGHGIVHKSENNKWRSHHNWWLPNGIDPTHYCTEIKGC